MKTSRFKTEYRVNASSLHKKIGDVLKSSSLFSTYKIYQEYPVNKINLNYSDGRHKFDWVILDLYLVIEVHGQQHYKQTSFGGIDSEQAYQNFIDQQFRDRNKMNAAIEAGFTYLCIPYFDVKHVDESYIWNMFKLNKNDIALKKKEVKEQTSYDIKLKEKTKAHRQKEYQKMKEFKKRGNDSE